MTQQIQIASRFNGPSGSGNGGYSCGAIAQFIDGPCAVRLLKPPPLDTDIDIRQDSAAPRIECSVWCGEQQIALAHAEQFSLALPRPPAVSVVAEASKQFSGFTEHPYPGCFVCGPQRAEGDGLRVFAGPVADSPFVAALWTPSAAFADGNAMVKSEILWAALDCPGGFAFSPAEGNAMLLGEFSVAILKPVAAARTYRILAWELQHTGRKHLTATALYDEQDECLAYGRGTWIEVSAN